MTTENNDNKTSINSTNSSTYKTANEFKENTTLAERLEQSTRIIRRHPDRIPVICDAYREHDKWTLHPNYLIPTKKKDITPNIDTIKFLFPGSYNIRSMFVVFRNRLKLSPESGFTLFVGNEMINPVSSKIIQEYYDEYKNEDGFLYIKYACEATFG